MNPVHRNNPVTSAPPTFSTSSANSASATTGNPVLGPQPRNSPAGGGAAFRAARRLPPLANVKFAQNVPPDMQEAATCVLHALQSQILPTSIQIKVQAASAQSLDYAQGETLTLDPKRNLVLIAVAQDHPGGTAETPDERFARFACTLTHELHLHALPYIGFQEAAKRGQSLPRQGGGDHEFIYTPANDNNAYFQAVRTVALQLPESARPTFLKEYLRDLNTLITMQAGSGGMAAAARAWANRLAQSFGYADLASGIS